MNPTLNAVIHRRFAAASEEASAELPDGAFRGVPILLKDLGAPQAGEPYCEGTGFAKAAGHRATRDSYLVQRLKKAGFVILGRTNTPELGTAITTEPVAFGPTRNPWDTAYSSGGSSGGSAAAVASGMVPLAHGNDGGGSIRIPASCCGLFGLKPSRGRVSKGPAATESWNGLSVDHVLARSVRDSAGVLDQIAETGRATPSSPHRRSAPSPRRWARTRGGFALGCSIAPTRDDYVVDPECSEAVLATGRLLESLGHSVELAHPASLGEADYQRHFLVVVSAAVATALVQWSAALGREISAEEYEPRNRLLSEMGRASSAPDYVESVLWLEGFRRRTASFWSQQGFDLLCTPVLALRPARPRRAIRPGRGRAAASSRRSVSRASST